MTQAERNKKKGFFWIFILFSLLFHLQIGLWVFFFLLGDKPGKPTDSSPPEPVVFVRPDDFIQEPTQVQSMEIADIAKPKVEQAPKKARFISQYNSSVKKETVAKKIPKKAKIDAETSEEGENPTHQKTAQKSDLKESKHAPVEPEEKLEKSPTISDLSLKPSDFEEFKETKEKDKKDGQKLAFKSDRLGEPFQHNIPGPGDHFVHDFFPNVQIGDKTYLNTAAFPNVQYFTQLKRIFRLRFNPAPPLRAYFSGNRVVLGKVDVTMAVTVAKDGRLEELFVVKSSGIPGYDREALETIRESSPFKSPPNQFLDHSGKLRMTWSFITYL